jgi:excisionase family DNA binding protein
MFGMEEKLLTIGQAAEYLGVSLNTLRRWDESGKLVAINKDGGTHRYYREKDLEIFASDLMKFASDWILNFPVDSIARRVLFLTQD